MTATPTDDEIALLARLAGLDLPPEYLAGTGRRLRHTSAAWSTASRRFGHAATNRRMCSCRTNSFPRENNAVSDLPFLTIAEAARLIATRKIVPGGVGRGHPVAHRRAGPSARQLRHPHRGPRPGRSQGGGGGDHGERPAQPHARHSVLPEGHLRHRRHPHDGDVEIAGRQCPDAGFPLPGETRGGRRRTAGQECDMGVRAWRAILGRAVPAGAQSVEPRPFAGRFVVGVGRRQSPPGSAPATLGTDTGGSIRSPAAAVRHRRVEADLRPGQPARRDPELLQPRPCRSAGLDHRGRGDPVAGDRRP